MEIKLIPSSKINPAPYNPRVDLKPGDFAYETLKRSMENFGYVEPLVWNERTSNLISGHQRLKIMLAQNVSELEVSVVDLSLEKEKLLNLALNKIRGDWEEGTLAKMLKDLQGIPDIDISLSGFDMPEISELFDKYLSPKKEDDFDFENAVESIETPITKEGDLIILGPHRILCGDSANPDNLKRLLNGERPLLVHTDPPYNVNYYGGNRPTPKARPRASREWERIYFDNLSQEEYEVWFEKIITNALSSAHENASLYVWNGHRQFGPMYNIFTKLALRVACVITWAKPNFSISYSDYNQQTEFCLYGWKKNGTHLWYGPTNESTLWEIKRDPTSEYIHPTQKPTAIAERAIRNSSQRGDGVLDLFLGSGSTLIAAEKLERRCYGLEIDARYVDAIVRRYAALVGREALSEDVRNRYFLTF